MTAPSKHVDAYLKRLPADQRSALGKLRNTIRAAAPESEESIKYRVPSYKYNGWLVFFAAMRNHLSLVTASAAVVERFRSELKGFDISGTTIHFAPRHPLPATLVRKIVKARMRENEVRSAHASPKR